MSKQSYSETYTANLRLEILRALAAVGEEINLSILRAMLKTSSAHDPAMETLAAEVNWLADKGLVTKRALGSVVNKAAITTRGDDVAHGRTSVWGVEKPGPDDLPDILDAANDII